MSGAIVVPLTEMQQLAEQWRATINEMDAIVQHIAREITSIPDSGKGLNEVRSRGRTVGSHHQQLLGQGMMVQKQVVDSVQRFLQADQELAWMVRSQSNIDIAALWGNVSQLGNLSMLGKISKVSSNLHVPSLEMAADTLNNFKIFVEGVSKTCSFLDKSDTIKNLMSKYPELLKALEHTANTSASTLSKYSDGLWMIGTSLKIVDLASDWYMHKDDTTHRKELEARLWKKGIDISTDAIWTAGYKVPYLNVALLTHDVFHFIGNDIGVNGLEALKVIDHDTAEMYHQAFEKANMKENVKKWIADDGPHKAIDYGVQKFNQFKDFVVQKVPDVISDVAGKVMRGEIKIQLPHPSVPETWPELSDPRITISIPSQPSTLPSGGGW